MTCEYCGTKFKSKYDVIKVITKRPGIHTLSADVAVTNEAIKMLGAEKASEIALRNIADKMAKCIMPYISIQTSKRVMWIEDTTAVRGEK